MWCCCLLRRLPPTHKKARDSKFPATINMFESIRGSGAQGINCQGGSGSFGAYFTARIGVIGEVGGCKVTGLPSGTTSHELNYLVRSPRLFPNAQRPGIPLRPALSAANSFRCTTGLGSASTNAFAMTAGGGVDLS